MAQTNNRIIQNKRLKGNYWRCVFDALPIARKARPGQFMSIRLSGGLRPFLRRPFSIHNVQGSKVEILYEVLGEGTRALSSKRPGESLDIIGPLGNGFNYQLPITNYRLPILIAGGIGVAPLLFLARKIKAKGKIMLIGARAREQILCIKEFKDLGYDVKIATDDGSAGFKGRVTDLLKVLLTTNNRQLITIYACGPKPMLKAASEIAVKYKIPAQVSLEEHMSCGIGACLGCVTRVKNQKPKIKDKDLKLGEGIAYQRVCKEGPVFEAKDLIF